MALPCGLMRPLLLLLLTASACREPFGTDRHDLVGFRIAAISAANTDDGVQLSTLSVVDGRPYADAPPTYTWHDAANLQPEDIAALPPTGGLAAGPRPVLPAGTSGPIALVATVEDRRWNGILDLSAALGPRVSLAGVDAFDVPLDLDGLTGTDVTLEARGGLPDGDPTDEVLVGSFARLRARTDDGVRVRWMSTAPAGRFLELDDRTTDWVAGEFEIDDEDLENVEVGEAGARTIVALALDPASGGANAWTARELWVGEAPLGIYTDHGRWLGVDSAVTGPFVQGTLTADDGAPTGLTLTGAADVPADTDPGTAALPCGTPVSGPFDPTWLFEQRCARGDVVGATVVVKIR